MTKQQSLPGVGPKQIPEIEDAAEALRDLRSKRQELAEKEEKAQQVLADALKKHGFGGKRRYVFEIEEDGNQVKLDAFMERPDARAYVRKHKDTKDTDKEPDNE